MKKISMLLLIFLLIFSGCTPKEKSPIEIALSTAENQTEQEGLADFVNSISQLLNKPLEYDTSGCKFETGEDGEKYYSKEMTLFSRNYTVSFCLDGSPDNILEGIFTRCKDGPAITSCTELFLTLNKSFELNSIYYSRAKGQTGESVYKFDTGLGDSILNPIFNDFRTGKIYSLHLDYRTFFLIVKNDGEHTDFFISI